MLTKPSPPKLLNSVEELVQQDEIGYFIEIGARNENLGKDSPPGSTLKFVLQGYHALRWISYSLFPDYFMITRSVLVAPVQQMQAKSSRAMPVLVRD